MLVQLDAAQGEQVRHQAAHAPGLLLHDAEETLMRVEIALGWAA